MSFIFSYFYLVQLIWTTNMNPEFLQQIFVYLLFEYFYKFFIFYIYCNFLLYFDLHGILLPCQNTQKVNKQKNCCKNWLFVWDEPDIKGQSISTCLLVSQFLPKTNENKSTWGIIVVNLFLSVFGRSDGLKKSFRLCLTFSLRADQKCLATIWLALEKYTKKDAILGLDCLKCSLFHN